MHGISSSSEIQRSSSVLTLLDHNSRAEFLIITTELKNNPYAYVWGDVLPIFARADLRVINLETSVTRCSKKWPHKAFNFRMHPDNVKILKEAKIDFVSLANNHALDYSVCVF